MNISSNITSIQAHQTMMNNNANNIANGNTDLAKELPDQIIIQKATETNVQAIKTKDEMFGTLLDMKV